MTSAMNPESLWKLRDKFCASIQRKSFWTHPVPGVFVRPPPQMFCGRVWIPREWVWTEKNELRSYVIPILELYIIIEKITKSRLTSLPSPVPAVAPWKTGASGGGTTRATSPLLSRSRYTVPRRSPCLRNAAPWPCATRGTPHSWRPCMERRPKALIERDIIIKLKVVTGYSYTITRRKCCTSLLSRMKTWLILGFLPSCRSPRSPSLSGPALTKKWVNDLFES